MDLSSSPERLGLSKARLADEMGVNYELYGVNTVAKLLD